MAGRAFARGSLPARASKPAFMIRARNKRAPRFDDGSPISNATSALENAICRSTCRQPRFSLSLASVASVDISRDFERKKG